MQAKPVLLAACLALLICAALAAAQDEPKPTVSPDPLSVEQLAVYRAVLGNWMAQDVPAMNLSIQTIPLVDSEMGAARDCGKGLDMEPASPTVVHRFRQQDLAQLGSGRTFTFVDPDQQRQLIQENDPEHTMGQGRSIEDAVRNGFAHGLATLSEIQFDKSHTHAIVSFGFVCGSLCGNGGTEVMVKTNGEWGFQNQCGGWISRASPPSVPESQPRT